MDVLCVPYTNTVFTVVKDDLQLSLDIAENIEEDALHLRRQLATDIFWQLFKLSTAEH